jgi:glycosyltransferase involved in cell wall biosynthesis
MGPSTMPTTSGIQEQVTRGDLFDEAVNLLYVCDFPPSNFAGGPILMSRLLQDYPPDRIVVLTSSRYLRVSPEEGRLTCAHIAFPTTNGWGRWGLGRMKNVIDWLMIPVLTLVTIHLIRTRRIEVIMTIAHGRFFVVAALAGWITRTPYIVVMHDDKFTPAERQSWVLKYVLRSSVRWAFLRAGHIYAISPEMQQLLKSEYGVDSELQRPGTERDRRSDSAMTRLSARPHSAVILFAGAITDAVEDSLKLLAEILVTGKLQVCGIQSAELHLYTQLSPERIRDWGWDHPSISVHGWVSQQELQGVLQSADILFLPFSFSERVRYAVESAFPSKTADYLAAGKPILVFGPPYSSLVHYGAQEGFAEIVTEFSADALARGIHNIVASPEHRDTLASRALEVFSQHHDIDRQRSQFLLMLNTLTGGSHV